VVAASAEGIGYGNQARDSTGRKEVRFSLQMKWEWEEFDFMAAAGDLDEIEEVNANCILM
nr:hypothetical protein [Tanacetum cinerariifolium]